jgi:very-short-patch-repair endonuclease
MVLIAAGCPAPVCQHEVLDGRGTFVARLDLAYPERKLAIEYEGDHHRSRERLSRRDLHRINRLRALGWTVLRFGRSGHLSPTGRVIALCDRVRQLASKAAS